MFVSHPLIKPNSIEHRLYQETLLGKLTKRNALVVLPTGTGKTLLAALAIAHRLGETGKALLLAPTKPLVEQHRKTLEAVLNVPVESASGAVSPAMREEIYSKFRVICATPQVIQNDLIRGTLDLKDFVLVVYDEAHRATGEYAYCFIAAKHGGAAMGLTASPGHTEEAIREVCRNLNLETVEVRTETDSDVKPYVKPKGIEWRMVELPLEFKEIHELLQTTYKERLKKLKEFEIISTVEITKRELLGLQGKLRGALVGQRSDVRVLSALSGIAEAIKVEHALELVESQGIGPLYNYLEKLRSEKSQAARRLWNDNRFVVATTIVGSLKRKGIDHPKLGEVRKIVEETLAREPAAKIVVFSNYRDSVEKIVETLKGTAARTVALIGQAGEKGLSQKEQIELLNRFRSGEANVLVGSCVIEEGLHVSDSNLAIFYEPVSSALRSIQRRGRVGRLNAGKIIVLVTKGTRDERYRWMAHWREKRMVSVLKGLQKKQAGLENFI